MKKHLLNLVLDGQKTQTIRAWKRKPPKVNTICKLNFQVPVIITETYQKKIRDLTVEELGYDGFLSMEEFRKTWLDCYPSFDPEQEVWIIRFRLHTPKQT